MILADEGSFLTLISMSSCDPTYVLDTLSEYDESISTKF